MSLLFSEGRPSTHTADKARYGKTAGGTQGAGLPRFPAWLRGVSAGDTHPGLPARDRALWMGGEGKQVLFPWRGSNAPGTPGPQLLGSARSRAGWLPGFSEQTCDSVHNCNLLLCVAPASPGLPRLQRHSPWLLTTATCFTPCFLGIWPLRAAPRPALPCIPLPGPVLAGMGGGGKVSAAAHGLRRPPLPPRGPGVRLRPRRAAGRARSPQPDPISKECACRVLALEKSWGFKAWLTEHAWDRQDPGQMWLKCPSGGCPALGPLEGHQPRHS